MIIRSMCRLFFALLAAFLSSAASASSIQYTASFAGLPAGGALQSSIAVDVAQGGSYQVAAPILNGSAYSSLEWTRNSLPLDGSAIILFHAADSSDPTKNLGQVAVDVPYNGTISGDRFTADLQGGYTGTGAVSPTYSFTNSNTPPLLVDLLAHPDRVHLSAHMTGGGLNVLLTTMTIDPQPEPAPVPEPSVLATLVVGLGSLVLRGDWRRHARCSQS